jgi:hypothetical protein
MPDPWQNAHEWLAYLQFAEAYFQSRRVARPIVVELGVYENRQRPYYVQFLGAEHIGIDISNQYTEPDILGDTHAEATVDRLRERLAGRNVDLLFIDADHEYTAARRDYELYNPFVKQGLIAFHDLYSYPNGVGRVWREITEELRNHSNVSFLEFKNWSSPKYMMGIGVIIRPGANG